MPERELDVSNQHGLHARPAALFVQTAARFVSTITVENLTRNGRSLNAKSIMDVMTAGIDQGTRIRISAEGDDAEAALDDLVLLVRTGLGQ